MGTFQPLTESFRELNNLLINQQRFGAQMQQREQQFALQSQLQGEQVKDQILQRRLTQAKVDEVERMNTPTSFSAYSIAPNSSDNQKYLYGNKQAMDEIAQALDTEGRGLTFSRADGKFYDAEGGEFLIAPSEIARRAPALTGIIDRRTDQMAIAADRITNLQRQRKGLAGQMKDASRGTRGKRDSKTVVENAMLRPQLQAIDRQIAEAQNFLTPQSLYTNYRNQKRQMSQRAAWATGQGFPELSKYFQRGMQEAADLEKTMLTKMLGNKSEKNMQQRLAVTVGPDGKVTNSMVVNVSRNLQGGLQPVDFDDNLRGYQWLGGVGKGGTGDGKGGNRPDRIQALKQIQAEYGGQLSSETGAIIGFDFEFEDERKYAEAVLAKTVIPGMAKDATSAQLKQATVDIVNDTKTQIIEQFKAIRLHNTDPNKINEKDTELLNLIEDQIGWGATTIERLLTEEGLL